MYLTTDSEKQLNSGSSTILSKEISELLASDNSITAGEVRAGSSRVQQGQQGPDGIARTRLHKRDTSTYLAPFVMAEPQTPDKHKKRTATTKSPTDKPNHNSPWKKITFKAIVKDSSHSNSMKGVLSSVNTQKKLVSNVLSPSINGVKNFIEDLENKLKMLQDQNQKLSQELSEIKNRSDTKYRQCEEDKMELMRVLNTTKTDLNGQIDGVKAEKVELNVRLKQCMEEKEKLNKNCTSELENSAKAKDEKVTICANSMASLATELTTRCTQEKIKEKTKLIEEVRLICKNVQDILLHNATDQCEKVQEKLKADCNNSLTTGKQKNDSQFRGGIKDDCAIVVKDMTDKCNKDKAKAEEELKKNITQVHELNKQSSTRNADKEKLNSDCKKLVTSKKAELTNQITNRLKHNCAVSMATFAKNLTDHCSQEKINEKTKLIEDIKKECRSVQELIIRNMTKQCENDKQISILELNAKYGSSMNASEKKCLAKIGAAVNISETKCAIGRKELKVKLEGLCKRDKISEKNQYMEEIRLKYQNILDTTSRNASLKYQREKDKSDIQCKELVKKENQLYGDRITKELKHTCAESMALVVKNLTKQCLSDKIKDKTNLIEHIKFECSHVQDLIIKNITRKCEEDKKILNSKHELARANELKKYTIESQLKCNVTIRKIINNLNEKCANSMEMLNIELTDRCIQEKTEEKMNKIIEVNKECKKLQNSMKHHNFSIQCNEISMRQGINSNFTKLMLSEIESYTSKIRKVTNGSHEVREQDKKELLQGIAINCQWLWRPIYITLELAWAKQIQEERRTCQLKIFEKVKQCTNKHSIECKANITKVTQNLINVCKDRMAFQKLAFIEQKNEEKTAMKTLIEKMSSEHKQAQDSMFDECGEQIRTVKSQCMNLVTKEKQKQTDKVTQELKRECADSTASIVNTITYQCNEAKIEERLRLIDQIERECKQIQNSLIHNITDECNKEKNELHNEYAFMLESKIVKSVENKELECRKNTSFLEKYLKNICAKKLAASTKELHDQCTMDKRLLKTEITNAIESECKQIQETLIQDLNTKFVEERKQLSDQCQYLIGNEKDLCKREFNNKCSANITKLSNELNSKWWKRVEELKEELNKDCRRKKTEEVNEVLKEASLKCENLQNSLHQNITQQCNYNLQTYTQQCKHTIAEETRKCEEQRMEEHNAIMNAINKDRNSNCIDIIEAMNAGVGNHVPTEIDRRMYYLNHRATTVG